MPRQIQPCMSIPQIVIDTNVLVAGMRSRRGCSHHLLTLVGTGKFDIHLSVPLVLEYEEVLYRERAALGLPPESIDGLIDFHCSVATHHEIFFLWRPHLIDPCDDMLLELAVKAQCEVIITFNAGDFAGSSQFGVRTATPAEFLRQIGEMQ